MCGSSLQNQFEQTFEKHSSCMHAYVIMHACKHSTQVGGSIVQTTELLTEQNVISDCHLAL